MGLLKELSALELTSSEEEACTGACLSGDLEFIPEDVFLPAAYTEWPLL